MLVIILLTTLALLMLFIVGLLFPKKVFLGPWATRERALLAYGLPGFVGFIMLMALTPKESTLPRVEAVKEKAPAAAPEQVGLPSVRFQGMMLPGRMSDAKAAGFTDCTASSYGYWCKSTTPVQLLGLTARAATLELDGENHFQIPDFVRKDGDRDVRMLAAEDLAYGTISYAFPSSRYDRSCVDKHHAKTGRLDEPIACIVNKNSVDQLTQALLDAGWVKEEDGRARRVRYVHARELVQIVTTDEGVRVERVSADTVREKVERDAQERAKADAASANASKVMDQMKR